MIKPSEVKGFCSYIRILNSIQNHTFFVRPMFSNLSADSLLMLTFAMSFSTGNNSKRKKIDTITYFCFFLVCLFVFFLLLFVTSFWPECTRNQVFNNLKATSLRPDLSSLPFGSLQHPAVNSNESRYSSCYSIQIELRFGNFDF